MGLLFILSTNVLQATTTNASFDLFEKADSKVGKGDFVADAVFFTLDQEVLNAIRQKDLPSLTLTIPFQNNKQLTLQLDKASYLATDFQVQLQANNTNSTLFYSPALFYSGNIEGEKDALVALNFFEDKVTGVLSLNGHNYNVGPYENGTKNTFVLFQEDNLNIKNPFECSTEDPVELKIERANASRSSENSKVRVYIECDNHLYKNLGSNAQRVTDFTTGLFNIVATLYQNESIELEISEIKIWTTPDPYPTSSAKNARNDFGQRLNGQFNGDIAHLLSNYKVNGTPPNGGSANIDVLCNKTKAVSYTNITTSYLDYPTFSWTAYAVTHEIGHNLGSAHTHSCLWPTGPIDNCWCPEGGCAIGPEPTSSGTMMSYCHLDPKWTNSCSLSNSNPGINFAAGFGQQPGNLIRAKVANASCLSGGTTTNTGGSTGTFTATTQVQDESCPGQKNGRINLSLQNGNSPYSYKWNTGSSAASLTNVAAGTYAVTVTDKSGKKATVNTVVQSGSTMKIDAGVDQVIGCGVTTVILDARNSASGFQYRDVWSKVGDRLSGSIYDQVLSVSEPGTYVYTITSEDTGCSVKDTVVVTENNAAPSLQITGEKITCNQSLARLTVNTSLSNPTYAWTGPNGFTSNKPSPSVETAGLYQLTVTSSGGCSSEGQMTVRSDVYQPYVAALGGVIDCASSSVQLQGSSNEQVQYRWSGPNGFTSSSQNPSSSIPGIYTLVVTTTNGCTSATTAQIGQSTSEADISVAGGELTCNSSSLQLQVSSNTTNFTYNWTGPNGFNSNAKNPLVSEAGVYTLNAVTANGCASTASAIVTASTDAPNVQVEGGIIACGQQSTSLVARSTNEISSYLWEGPNNFRSDKASLIVNQAGTYYLTVANANGCSSRISLPVIDDSATPSFSIFATDLSCESPSSQFLINTTAALNAYKWTGPENFQSNEVNPIITKAGTYTLTASGISGCATTQSYTVTDNTLTPSFTISAGAIDCNTTNTQLQVTATTPIVKYQWTGPNGFLSYEATPTVSLPGTYSLSATANNGCPAIQSYTIAANSNTPNVAVTASPLTCNNPSTTLIATTQSALSDYQWSGPNDFISYEENPRINVAGTYTLVATGTNGCSVLRTLNVEADFGVPVIEVLATDLTCSTSMAQISATTNNPTDRFLWTGPNGFQSFEKNPSVEIAGRYELTVYSANGCSNKEVVDIKTTAVQIADVEFQNDDCGTGEGAISVIMKEETEEYYAVWNTGQTGLEITNLPAGTYSCVIKNSVGCSVTFSHTIKSAPAIAIQSADISKITCHGAADGIINVSVSGGLAPYQLLWSNGVEGGFNSDLGEGVHTLEVVDAKNCVRTFYFELNNPELLEVTTEIGEEEAEFFVTGGRGEYTYNWNNGLTGRSEMGLEEGAYSVTIADANGCSVEENFTIKSIDVVDYSTGEVAEEENAPQTEMISPNPADTYFNLYYDFGEEQLIFVSIFNAQGYYLYRSTVETTVFNETINSTGWENGTYYVQILTKDGFITEELKVVHN